MTATVRDVLALKNSAVVFTCGPDTSVAEAARALRDRRVGCLVVAKGGEVQGLLTEREVTRCVVAEGRDPATTHVRDVMERTVASVALDAGADEVEALLRRRRVRYVPVVGARGLLGMISLGDVARFYAMRERAAVANDEWEAAAH